MANCVKLQGFSVESERSEIQRRLRKDALDAMPREPLEMFEKPMSREEIALGDDDDWDDYEDDTTEPSENTSARS